MGFWNVTDALLPGDPVSNFVDDLTGVTSAREANAANRQNADRQMEFQREMSNTSYQRAMADMRAAGLNPMLAARNGGASTPNGAMAQAQDTGNGLGRAANMALSAYTGVSAAQQSTAAANQADSQAALNAAQIGKVVAETENAGHTGKNIAQTTKKLAAETAAITSDNVKRNNKSRIQQIGSGLLDLMLPGVSKSINAAKSLDTVSKSPKFMDTKIYKSLSKSWSNRSKPSGFSNSYSGPKSKW